MDILNFYSPHIGAMQDLRYCVTCGLSYEQAAKALAVDYDIYLPRDQFDAYSVVLNIQLDLDKGFRKSEVPKGSYKEI